jgi:aryl-alcohol dehydrogenase-like predicted oxidoreductase
LCGRIWDDAGNVDYGLRAESMRRELENSLRRLGVDVIDLYQIHWPDPNTPIEESWGQMARFFEQGKVRYIGVSNFDLPLLERCEAIRQVDSLQPPYSLLRRDVETDILPFCAAHGIGVVPYSPMQSGLLSGTFDMSRLAQSDRRPAITQASLSSSIPNTTRPMVSSIRAAPQISTDTTLSPGHLTPRYSGTPVLCDDEYSGELPTHGAHTVSAWS